MKYATIEDEIDQLKFKFGVITDKALAQILNIDPSAIAAWRKRGSVPAKYELLARIEIAKDYDYFDIKPIDELSVHILSEFLNIFLNSNGKLFFFLVPEEEYLLSASRVYFRFETLLRQRVQKAQAKLLERQLTVVRAITKQFEGEDGLRNLVKFLDL